MKAYIHSGQLSAGHARMLVGQPNADELARDIVKRGLNVRQVEEHRAQERPRAGEGGEGQTRGGKDADTMALERRVSDALGLNVTIDHKGKGGVLHVEYKRPRAARDVLRGWSGSSDARSLPPGAIASDSSSRCTIASARSALSRDCSVASAIWPIAACSRAAAQALSAFSPAALRLKCSHIAADRVGRLSLVHREPRLVQQARMARDARTGSRPARCRRCAPW